MDQCAEVGLSINFGTGILNMMGGPKLHRQRKYATAIAIGMVSATLILFQNCSNHDSAESSNASQEVFSQTQSKALSILNNKCAACHDFATDVAQLETAGWLVVGDPTSSAMYLDSLDKAEPRDGNYLTEDELVVIRDWIALLGENWDTLILPPPVDDSGVPLVAGTYGYVKTFAFQKCAGCHTAGGNQGGLNLDNYNQARGAAALSLQRMTDGSMPPGNVINATPAEIQFVQEWIDNGLVQ